MKSTMILPLVLMVILLAGCGGSNQQAAIPQGATSGDTSVPVSALAPALDEDYPDALSVRNQLTLGTLRLEDNPGLAVTPAQAEKLLPLWQALRSLTRSGTGAAAEIDALQAQIQQEMTPGQLQAINEMQLSRADTQAMAQEWGLATGDGTGSGAGQPGGGRNMSEAERAATGATERGGGVSAALLDRLIQLLEERAS